MDQKEIINRLSYFMFLRDIFESGAYAKLSPSAKAIYPIIGLHINRDGEAFLSISRIEKLSGLSRHSVIDGVKELVEKGFIAKIKGNSLRSNRFMIIFEYEGSVMVALRQCNGYTRGSANNIPDVVQKSYQRVVQKFHPNKVIYNKLVQSSNKKQEITTNIINIQDSQVNISKDSGSGNTFQKIVHELNLKDTGKDLLRKYMDDYSEDWVNRAFTESVKRSNPSLHYIEGILKKWYKDGRISEGTLNEALRNKENEKKETQKQKEIQNNERIKVLEQKTKFADELISNLSINERGDLEKETETALLKEGINKTTPGYNLALKIKQRENVLEKYNNIVKINT